MKNETSPNTAGQISLETVLEKQSLFNGKLEFFNLALPLVFIFGSVITFFAGNQISLSENSPMNFLVRIILFNQMHIYLPLIFFLVFPEFKAWSKTKTVLLLSPSILFVAFFVTVGLVQYIFKIQTFEFIIFFIYLVRLHHSLFQVYGLHTLYEFKNPPQIVTEETKRKNYKPLFYALFFVLVPSYTLKYLPSLQPLLLSPAGSFMQHLTVALGLLITTWIVYLTAKEPQASQSNRTLYSVRIYLYALGPISPLAILGFAAHHGVEYLLVFHKMGKTSQKKLKQFYFYTIVFVFLPLLSLPYLYSKSFFQPFSQNSMGSLIIAFLLASEMTHYLIDSQIYKFKDKATRKEILPLLLKKNF